MGASITKICLSCQKIVKKRRQKSCPKCGGKIVSLSAGLVERLCLMAERSGKSQKKLGRLKLAGKEKTGGEIW